MFLQEEILFLPNMTLNKKQYPIKWKTTITELPTNNNDLAFYSIEQLAYLIQHKKISSLKLTQFFIERLKKWVFN